MHVLPGLVIALGGRPPESPGTLYISTKYSLNFSSTGLLFESLLPPFEISIRVLMRCERRVMWLSDADRDNGYAVDFLLVSLHAVSRDPEAYPQPCIYAQIEIEVAEDEESEGSDSEYGPDVELSKVFEMRLVPSDPSQLDALFDIFCQCAELKPEPHEEGDEENRWVFCDEEMADNGSDSEWQPSENLASPIGYGNGSHDLARHVLELQINDQHFDDAEEVEHESHDDRQ